MARCLNPILLNVGVRKVDFSIPVSEIRKDDELRRLSDYNKMPMPILAPCGKCYNCRINRSRDWTLRVMLEHSYGIGKNKPLIFLTLTYNNHFIGDNSLNYRHIQLFLKRLRKHYKNQTIKYLVCGEYGAHSGRMHWHLIILGLKRMERDVIKSLWNYGFVHVSLVRSYSAVGYTLKYALKNYLIDRKEYLKEGRTPPLFKCSQGLGKIYFEKNYEEIISKGYFEDYYGYKYRIPRYFRVLYRRFAKYDGWEHFLDNFPKVLENILSCIYEYNLPTFLLDLDYRYYENLKSFIDKARPIMLRENERLYNNHFKNFVEKI